MADERVGFKCGNPKVGTVSGKIYYRRFVYGFESSEVSSQSLILITNIPFDLSIQEIEEEISSLFVDFRSVQVLERTDRDKSYMLLLMLKKGSKCRAKKIRNSVKKAKNKAKIEAENNSKKFDKNNNKKSDENNSEKAEINLNKADISEISRIASEITKSEILANLSLNKVIKVVCADSNIIDASALFKKQGSLPDCPVCLDTTGKKSGCVLIALCGHRIHFNACLQKISSPTCPLCRFDMHPCDMWSRCAECEAQSGLWMCLLCGHVGCSAVDGRAAPDVDDFERKWEKLSEKSKIS